MARKIIALIPILLLLGGCPGGGGSKHTPPPSLKVGEKTTLQLTLSTWGSGGGRITERYTGVACRYRVKGDKSFTRILFSPIREVDNGYLYECVLPAFSEVGIEVEYFISLNLDGVHNRRNMVTLEVK